MQKMATASWLCVFMAWSATARAQHVPPELAPELILHNARIVTMDDASFQSSVGTIADAMAVRDGRIVAVGTNSAIRALAGVATRQLDLGGRMVLPSFIMTHEHPTDWMFAHPAPLAEVLPEGNEVLVARWLAPAPFEEQLRALESTLKEAAAKARPGQWILVSFNWGADYEYAGDVLDHFGGAVTTALLDRLAPNHPVKVRDGFIGGVINSLAVEETRRAHDHDMTQMYHRGRQTAAAARRWEQGQGSGGRPIEPDVIFQGRIPLLAEVLKAEMALWASFGITTFGSSAYAHNNFRALSYLDREGTMPGRFAWAYSGPEFSTGILRRMAALVGHGTDHLWNVGAWSAGGGRCYSLAPLDPEAEVVRAGCSFEPGSPGREILERIIRTGGRVATMHSVGDRDIDYLMDAIEKASQEAGFTPEEIRARRHAFDHAALAPRPDQLPRMQRLGMMVSMMSTILWETHRDYNAAAFADVFGIEATNWTLPRRSVTEAGIMSTFEIDRPMPQRLFDFVHRGITRHNERTGRTYGARQAVDRIIQMKAMTIWGAHYLLREDRLGSLEPGKLADFVVVDRNYLTIPEDDIPNVAVLMTAVGGRTVHLVPSLAGELGLEPVGPVTWRTKPLEKYYPHPAVIGPVDRATP